MRALTERQRRRGQTAVHEAGHAVVGRVLDLNCGSASIVENEAEGEAGHAIIADPLITHSAWEQRNYEEVLKNDERPTRLRDVRAAFRGTIVARMAGAEAERVLLVRCQDGDGFDRHVIGSMAAATETAISDDLWSRYEPRMRRQTRRLVYKHREAIRLVANALLKRGKLKGKQIDRIVGSAKI